MSKLKNYELAITAGATVVVVGAKDENHAIEIAKEQINCGDFEIVEAGNSWEIPTEAALRNCKLSADFVTEPES